MKKLDKSTICNFVAATPLMMLSATNALAVGIGDSQIATGLNNLFSDLSTWLIILSPIVAGAMAIYFIIRRSMADEQDGKLWEKRIKTAVVCGVAGALVGGLIKLLASYF